MMACSTKKNTAVTRAYHSINTKYNIHYNANIAYQEALKQKEDAIEDNLSQMLYIYPDNSDTTETKVVDYAGFTTAIDKTTKAIKLHSIKVRPRRDPSKKKDANYQAWLKQKEFNPYLKNTWMLLGKSELESGNYLRAATTFLYITKIYSTNPEIVAECRLLTARAYTEMGWLYEAGNILYKVDQQGDLPTRLEGLYASVKANYLIRTEDYKGAIPDIEMAISKGKSKIQKTRMQYLLGQVYAQENEPEKASEAFGKVSGLNTPYSYTLNAKLQQYRLSPLSEKNKNISQLEKMAKKKKNESYLDQIYMAIGDSYLELKDTTNTIANYKLAIEKSVKGGLDKGIVLEKLGSLYFSQRKYIQAQPAYSQALAILPKSYQGYKVVAVRSDVLDELVVHVKTLTEQDSLQHLASLPEVERLEFINNYIEKLKKEEKEAKEKEKLEKQKEERQERIDSWAGLDSWGDEGNTNTTSLPSTLTGTQGSLFYFYNEQAVAQGKVSFQKQWGTRKLEDDWRRTTKTVSTFDDFDMTDGNISHQAGNDSISSDSIKTPDIENNFSGEKYSPEYYLQQLPLTPEKIEASNVLIENALYQMGLIYKVKLEDFILSIDAFDTDLTRFPATPNKEDIYYQLFLIYMQLNNSQKMDMYRNKLIAEFPDGKYTKPLLQPNYEWNFRHMAADQDSLYNETYKAYLAGNIEQVRANYNSIQTKYPFVDLMPKFMLLNALTYAQTRDAKGLSINLKKLVDTYPKSDVEPLASNILSRIKDGKILLSDGKPIRGIDWNLVYAVDSTMLDSEGKLIFSDDLNAPYMLLLRYKEGSIDRNELLYQIADYNFSNYVVQTFDLDFDTQPPVETMQIKGFKAFSNIYSYINKGFGPEGFIPKLDTSIVIIPISVDNYKAIYAENGLESYMDFFKKNLGYQLPKLMNYWNNHSADIEYIDDLDDSEQIKVIDDSVKAVENMIRPIDENKISGSNGKKPEVKEDAEGSVKIDLNEALSPEQQNILNKGNDIYESAEEILNNPVDGIKNMFNKFKDKKKMSKEEKEALKQQEALEKERLKKQREANKIVADSLREIEKQQAEAQRLVEKATQDSIQQVEKQKQEEQRQIKAAKEAEVQAKKDAQKQREQERKDKENAQKEKLRLREQERKEKEQAQNEKRKEREKQREELLKQREQERKEKEKARKESQKES